MLSSMSGRTLVLPAAAPRRVTAKPVKAVASSDVSQKLGSTAAAASLALLVTLGAADFAEARTVSPYAGLTPCAGNAAFAKREKQEVKGLTKRLAKYEEGSAPALALNATIAKTKARFANYGDAGLLCGADGLPHLIVDGNLQHLGEFAYPGLGFLYVAGWIGHAGRSYVINNKLKDKPLDGEIIIDVPSALNTMFASAAWPVLAFKEWQAGTLFEDDDRITVSPR